MESRGISRPSLGTFLSHSTEKIRRGTLVFQKNSGLKKLHRLVYHDFVENWFSHISEKFRWGTLDFSETFSYRKFLWIEVRYHDYLSEHFCLTVPEIFRRGTLCLSEKFWYRKFWRIRAGYHFLPSKNFCLTVPQIFVKEQFCVSENFWYRTFSCRRGGSRYCVGNFLFHSIENFRSGILVFQKICGLKKCIRKCITILSKNDCLTVPKFS